MTALDRAKTGAARGHMRKAFDASQTAVQIEAGQIEKSRFSRRKIPNFESPSDVHECGVGITEVFCKIRKWTCSGLVLSRDE